MFKVAHICMLLPEFISFKIKSNSVTMGIENPMFSIVFIRPTI